MTGLTAVIVELGNATRGRVDEVIQKARVAGRSADDLLVARKLIDDMAGPWKPQEFEDTYNDDLMKRIEEKIERGETKVLPKPEGEAREPRSAKVIDLMDLLKQSIDKTGGRAFAARANSR